MGACVASVVLVWSREWMHAQCRDYGEANKLFAWSAQAPILKYNELFTVLLYSLLTSVFRLLTPLIDIARILAKPNSQLIEISQQNSKQFLLKRTF